MYVIYKQIKYIHTLGVCAQTFFNYGVCDQKCSETTGLWDFPKNQGKERGEKGKIIWRETVNILLITAFLKLSIISVWNTLRGIAMNLTAVEFNKRDFKTECFLCPGGPSLVFSLGWLCALQCHSPEGTGHQRWSDQMLCNLVCLIP